MQCFCREEQPLSEGCECVLPTLCCSQAPVGLICSSGDFGGCSELCEMRVSVGRAVLLGEQGGTWIPAMKCWVGKAGQGNINSPAWLCAHVGLIRTGAARLYIQRRRSRFQTHT